MVSAERGREEKPFAVSIRKDYSSNSLCYNLNENVIIDYDYIFELITLVF
jgi:hypothetical protein